MVTVPQPPSYKNPSTHNSTFPSTQQFSNWSFVFVFVFFLGPSRNHLFDMGQLIWSLFSPDPVILFTDHFAIRGAMQWRGFQTSGTQYSVQSPACLLGLPLWGNHYRDWTMLAHREPRHSKNLSQPLKNLVITAAWVYLGQKEKKEKLKVAKRFLNKDFKVTLCCYCNCNMLHGCVKKLGTGI